ncbi:MAG: shikimate kinase [Bdellovibrionota bacterium]
MAAPSNIVLLGFMGAGKSTVGKELAKKLSWKLVDLDERIEKAAGRSVGEIFDKEGETGFRAKETAALRAVVKEAAKSPGIVLSTGGGVVTKEENWPLLKETGSTVYLSAEVSTILARVKNSDVRRPLLETPDPEAAARLRLRERLPLYSRASMTIVTDGKTPEAIAGEILDRLKISAS